MDESTRASHAIRFGVFEVDLRSGELRKSGVKIRLQEQPLQVLAMLLEHPGEVVTREELQKKLWSTDTFVDFEHGLNKAINKIREALGDSADNPRFIETLPRRGYRFIYPVDVGAGSARPREGRPIPYPRWAAIALAAAIVLIIAGAIAYRYFRKAPAPPMEVVPFTSFPGQESSPSFSPDGNQIAFEWNGEKEDNWDIYVKVIGTESLLRLTTNPAIDRAPAWSPDGRHIAFHRHTESEDGIYLVPAFGGRERRLHTPDFGADWAESVVDWSPDGKYLAYSDRRPGHHGWSIFVLSVDNADDKRAVTSPSGPDENDSFPRFSPDGQTLAFARGTLGREDIHLVRFAGGEPRRLMFDHSWVKGLD